MRKSRLCELSLLFVVILISRSGFAQDYTRWGLPEGAKLRLGKGEITGRIAYSPDRDLLAVPSSIGVWLYDAKTGAEVNLLTGHSDEVNAVAFSPDRLTLASAGSSRDKTVRLWNVRTGTHLHTLEGHTRSVDSVAFSPDGLTLASGGSWRDNTVHLWDVLTGTPLHTLEGHTHSVESVVWSPDGSMLASGGVRDDHTVRLWDVREGEPLRVLKANTGVRALAFSQDGLTLAAGAGRIRLWDVRTGDLLRTFEERSGVGNALAFSPDASTLVSGGGAVIGLWDALTGKRLKVRYGEGSADFIVFSPDGMAIAGGSSRDGKVRLWNAHTGEEILTIAEHMKPIYSLAYSSDGRTLAIGTGHVYEGIRLWDVLTGQNYLNLEGHEHLVQSLAFSHDGSTLASGSWDDTARLWDVRTGKNLHVLREWSGCGDVDAVALSPDGRLLATVYGCKVYLWNVRTGERLETLADHLEEVSTIAFSPDGSTLASGGSWGDATIRLWDVRTANATHALVGHQRTVTSVAFSPDGLALASGGSDDTIRIWDANTGERLRTIEGHTSGVSSVAFSPDGLTLASGGSDDTIRIWDANTGERLRTIEGHAEWISSIAISPDGLTLASGSGDGTILLWDLMRSTTWGDTKRVSATDWTRQLPELSPSAAPLAPTDTALLPNYPNPFNPETWIPYQLKKPAEVTLTIFNMKGQAIRTLTVGYQPAGIYQSRDRAAYWDGRNQQGETVANGVYFYTVAAGDFTATRKMLAGK